MDSSLCGSNCCPALPDLHYLIAFHALLSVLRDSSSAETPLYLLRGTWTLRYSHTAALTTSSFLVPLLCPAFPDHRGHPRVVQLGGLPSCP